MSYLSMHSPIGDLTLFEEDGTLVSIDWGWVDDGADTPLLIEARSQLEQYFDGQRQSFELPLSPRGTEFQRKVWDALRIIPYGQTWCYADLAQQVGSAARAVGSACGRNPLPIIIPCHRIIAANGSLGGYSGIDGVDTKRALLTLEGYDAP